MTFRRYQELVGTCLIPALGTPRVRELHLVHVEAYKARLHSEGLAPSKIKHHLAVLSGALNRAVSWDIVIQNPTSEVGRPEERGLRSEVRRCEHSQRKRPQDLWK